MLDYLSYDKLLLRLALLAANYGFRIGLGNTIPVTQNSKLIGLLTADSIREFLAIQSALRQARKQKADFLP